MKLEELAVGQSLAGVEPTEIVSVVALVPLAEGSVQLIYRTPDGGMKERLLGRAEKSSIALASIEGPFSSMETVARSNWLARQSGSTSPSCSTR